VAEVATSPVTTSTWGGVAPDEVEKANAGLPAYGYDVAAAKALAKEAGVDGQQIVIATTPAFQAADVITSAVAQAAKDIGLHPKIETISPDKYTNLFSDPAARAGYDLFLTYWYTSLADPIEFYGVLESGQFSNYGGWSDPEYDRHIDAAIAAEVDDPHRVDDIRAAEKVMMGDLPWLPLYTAPTSLWLSDKVTGVQPSIYFMYFPWAATIGAR
jgi:peptide/nickel transport system substrate-binding protein